LGDSSGPQSTMAEAIAPRTSELHGSSRRIRLKSVGGGSQRSATLLLTASGLRAFICNIARLNGAPALRKLLGTSKRCRERLAVGIVEVFKDRVKLSPQMKSKLVRLAGVKNADLVLAALDYIWRRKAWDHKGMVAVLNDMLRRSPTRTMWASFALLCEFATVKQESYSAWFDRPARQAAVLFFSRSVRTSRLAAVAVVQPLLEHGDECVQGAAAEALEFLEKDPAVQIATWAAHMERMGSFAPATEAFRRIALHSDATRLSSLVAGLEHASPAVRMAALQALRNRHNDDMVDANHTVDGDGAGFASGDVDVRSSVRSANELARHDKRDGDRAVPWSPSTISEPRCYCLICIQQRLSIVEAVA